MHEHEPERGSPGAVAGSGRGRGYRRRTGQHFDLTADADTRAAVAQIAGLRDLPRLAGEFRRDAGTARRICTSPDGSRRRSGKIAWSRSSRWPTRSRRTVDLVFVPRQPPAAAGDEATASVEPRDVKWNDPEPLIGGVVDLGALATEFLILGLDPYPRKPGAVFEPPQDASRRRALRGARRADEGSGWPLIAVVSGRRTAIVGSARLARLLRLRDVP